MKQSYKFDQYMALLWPLWPLNLAFTIKLTPNDPNRGKKSVKFWVLDLGFGLQKFFWSFLIFLKSLVSKKSSGVQKSYFSVVFHHKELTKVIIHSSSLCGQGIRNIVWLMNWLLTFQFWGNQLGMVMRSLIRARFAVAWHGHYNLVLGRPGTLHRNKSFKIGWCILHITYGLELWLTLILLHRDPTTVSVCYANLIGKKTSHF